MPYEKHPSPKEKYYIFSAVIMTDEGQMEMQFCIGHLRIEDAEPLAQEMIQKYAESFSVEYGYSRPRTIWVGHIPSEYVLLKYVRETARPVRKADPLLEAYQERYGEKRKEATARSVALRKAQGVKSAATKARKKGGTHAEGGD